MFQNVICFFNSCMHKSHLICCRIVCKIIGHFIIQQVISLSLQSTNIYLYSIIGLFMHPRSSCKWWRSPMQLQKDKWIGAPEQSSFNSKRNSSGNLILPIVRQYSTKYKKVWFLGWVGCVGGIIFPDSFKPTAYRQDYFLDRVAMQFIALLFVMMIQ